MRWILLLVILPFLLTGLAVHLATRRPHVPTSPPAPQPEQIEDSTPAAKNSDTPVDPPLRVRVVGQNAEPLPDVRMELVSDPDGEDHAVLAAGTTTDDGRVELPAPPGRYGLRAFSPTHFGMMEIVEAPREDEFVVRLSPGVDFSLLVTDEEGQPLEGARVRDTWLDEGRVFLTGADGVARLGARHPQWGYTAVEKDGYLPRAGWMELLGEHYPAWQEKVMLRRGGLLVVSTVEHASGEPIPGTRVRISHHHGGTIRTTGEDGTVRFPYCLIPGEMKVFSHAPDGRGVSKKLTVDVGERERRVALLYPPGRTIAGVVVRAADQSPVEGARVFADDPWGEPQQRAVTDPLGAFRFGPARGNRQDRVRLRIDAPGLAMREADYDGMDPGPEGPERLRFELVPTSMVAGTVAGPDGEPVAGAEVSLRATGGESPLVVGDLSARTDDRGRYEITGVPPREVLVVVAESDGLGVGWSEDLATTPGGDVMVPGITLSGTWTFTGRVVDSDGAPVPLAWLWLHSRVRTEGTRAQWRVVEDGAFPPVTGVSKTGSSAEIGGPGFFDEAYRVEEGENELVLHRVHRATGQAIDAVTGLPIAKALLDFEFAAKGFLLEGRSEQAMTDLEGRFVAEKLRRGRYRVGVRGTKLSAEVDVTRDGQELGGVRFEVR